MGVEGNNVPTESQERHSAAVQHHRLSG